MEFQDVVRKRRMVRAFEPRPLPRDVVTKILRNAQRGPSSGYTQGFEFLVFDTPDVTEKFWRQLAIQSPPNPVLQTKAANAPLVIVPVAHSAAYVKRYCQPDKTDARRKTEKDWPAPHWFTDTAFASMLILLTAVDSNLGGYYFSVGANSSAIHPFKKAFGIPEEYNPMGAIAIGYPSDTSPSRPPGQGRRPISEVMHYGKW